MQKVDDETLWYRVFTVIKDGPSVESEGLQKNLGYLVAHKAAKFNAGGA